MRSVRLFVGQFNSSYLRTANFQNASMLNIAIIGGGAAGFFAAITAKQHAPEAHIVIFEKSSRVLTKVEMTGGGRCNLTNSFARITDLKQAYPRGDKLMKRLFNAFSNHDTCRWFESRGVALTVQPDECVFPQSQSSQTIVDCLTREARRLGIEISTAYVLESIRPMHDGYLELHFKNRPTQIFNRVAIATGGSPRIESLQYLADIGHCIEQPVPSLFTFNIPDARLRALMGTVADPIYLSVPATKLRSEGALLMTHWGISGPATLKLSSYAARYIAERAYRFRVAVNWVHETHNASVERQLTNIIDQNRQKQLNSIRPYHLSNRHWTYLIDRMAMPADKKWSELGRKGLNKMVETLTNDIYDVSGKGIWKDEFVTCGGISLADIHLNTLASKRCPNLFFAGEVLDIDAITGGFNLQAAWTTGYVVGQHISK